MSFASAAAAAKVPVTDRVAAINGVAMLRAYLLLFTGRRRAGAVSLAITGRERFAVLALAVLILPAGRLATHSPPPSRAAAPDAREVRLSATRRPVQCPCPLRECLHVW